MFFEDVELHNIEDLISVKGRPGLRMQRVPESIRIKLNKTAQIQMCQPTCAEYGL